MPATNSILAFLAYLALLGSSTFAQFNPQFRSPVKEIQVHDIRVQGNRTVDASLIIGTLQIQKESEYLPPVLREKIRESIYSLYQLGLFSDIQVEIEQPDTLDGAIFVFRVTELPTLAGTELKGNQKIKGDDIREVMDLLDGQVYSRSAVEKNRQKILDLYREKGYLLAEVTVDEDEDKDTGKKIIRFGIAEGKKVRVRYITFSGNKAVKDKTLRKQLSTKEDRWWRSGDYKDEEFRTSRDSLVDYYKQFGFLDAAVLGHTAHYSEDKKYLDVHVKISEGRRYRLGRVTFIHNNIVDDKALKAQVQLDSHELFDMKKYEATLFGIQSIYREQGYLFVNVDDQKTYRDSLVDLTFNIRENSIAHIQKVHVRGNTKTKDKVIRREIKLFPGDIFRQSMVMRSQRDILQLNYFDNVTPNIEPLPDDDAGEVNLVFDVAEKVSGTGTFSAGAAYSQRDQLVGTLGLQIPNFLGNGQRADMSLEYGGQKQLYSIGFTEPWFLDTPTLLGGSLFYNYQRALRETDNDFTRYGLRLNLGRRLTWPDDYFTVRGSYNLTQNENGEAKNPDFLLIRSGLESSVHLTLTRDDKDLPVFPTEGSRYSLNYSKIGGPLGGHFDYSQYEAKVNWWFPTFHKFVLGIETEFGLITGDNIQRYDLYQMGGLLGYQGKLRGYNNGSIGYSRVGRSFFSFVTELTYPVVDNTFYLLGFFDAGNVFGSLPINSDIPKKGVISPLEEIDLSDLRRDIGFGFRLVVPMIGIMGFDFGWPLDYQESYKDGVRYRKSGWDPQVNFVVEQGF